MFALQSDSMQATPRLPGRKAGRQADRQHDSQIDRWMNGFVDGCIYRWMGGCMYSIGIVYLRHV